MGLKPIMKYHYMFTRMVEIKEKIVTPNAGKYAEKVDY